MDKDRDNIRGLYDKLIEEGMAPLAVKSSAKGDGETGGLEPSDLPADTASTTEVQKGTGAESAKKNVETPEEAEEKLSPVSKNKGTDKVAKKKVVTAIKDSVEPRKSFIDLYDQVMIKEEGEIEDPEYNDEAGDFPEPEGEVPLEGEAEAEAGTEMDEGEIYSQLSELFAQLASIKGAEIGAEVGAEAGAEEAGMEDGEMPEAAESVNKDGNTIKEMKSEPEPKEDTSDISARQLPVKLAGKGVDKKAPKKVAIKGNDKKRTGELEDAPEGYKHDKGMMAVKGDGPAHNVRKGSDPSFVETA